jgi:PEP-CTERM motif-containing protein
VADGRCGVRTRHLRLFTISDEAKLRTLMPPEFHRFARAATLVREIERGVLMAGLLRRARSGVMLWPLVAIVAIGLSETVAADTITIPILITGGSAEVRNPGFLGPDFRASFGLTGPDGFVLGGSGSGSPAGGCGFCFSGHTGSLSTSIGANFGSITYQDLGGEFSLFRTGGGTLFFNGGPFTLPMTATGTLVFRSPFTLSGSIFLGPEPNPAGPGPSRRFAFSGSGFATASFTAGSLFGGDQEFRFDNAVYEFADSPPPVPEPGTMLLLATGLLGICRWNTRRCAS